MTPDRNTDKHKDMKNTRNGNCMNYIYISFPYFLKTL